MSDSSIPGIDLKPFAACHIERTFEWVSRPDLQLAFMMRAIPTWPDHQRYFARVLSDATQKVFAILLDGLHVGNCGFKHLDFNACTGELWIYVGDPDARGRGVASAALTRLLAYGDEVLGLRRACVHVAEDNVAARSLYRSAGFAEAGIAGGDWSGRSRTVLLMERGMQR